MEETKHKQNQQMHMSWWRFAAMVFTSTAVMFVLMYQLVYERDHMFFSMNRFVASLAMGGVMTVIMLGFMWSMYKGTKLKMAFFVGGALAAAGLLYVNRSQSLTDDTRFMKSMIPHHSIAINNARKATISDPSVRELANEIIAAQVREIELMKRLIEDIEKHGKRGNNPLPPRDAVVTEEMLTKIREVLK